MTALLDHSQPQHPQQVIDLIPAKVGLAGKVIVDLRAGHLPGNLDGEAVGRPASIGDGSHDGAADVGFHSSHLRVLSVKANIVDPIAENREGFHQQGVQIGGEYDGEHGLAGVGVDVVGEVAIGVETVADKIGNAEADKGGCLLTGHESPFVKIETISDISDTMLGENQGEVYNRGRGAL